MEIEVADVKTAEVQYVFRAYSGKSTSCFHAALQYFGGSVSATV